ncbi:MAG: hypothetical protein JST92_11295 [Deltaproteobacteria bacterium]|nr:hypothetical protein [Deltaproteobacteria bacterium]
MDSRAHPLTGTCPFCLRRIGLVASEVEIERKTLDRHFVSGVQCAGSGRAQALQCDKCDTIASKANGFVYNAKVAGAHFKRLASNPTKAVTCGHWKIAALALALFLGACGGSEVQASPEIEACCPGAVLVEELQGATECLCPNQTIVLWVGPVVCDELRARFEEDCR